MSELNTLINTLIGQFMPLSRSEREQNAFNQRMAEDAYNRQVEFYEKFNSPSAMVEQYKDAGINPALVSGYSPSMPPSSQAASGSGGSSAAQLLSVLSQIKQRDRELDIQNKLANADVDLKEKQGNNLEANTERVSLENSFIPALRSGEINKITEEFNLMREELNTEKSKQRLNDANVSLASANTLLTLIQYEIEDSTQDDKIRLAEALADSAEAKAKTDSVNARYAEKRVEAEINVMTSQAILNSANARQVKEFCIQYFENKDARGKSLFQNLTLSQMNELQSCMRLNDERTGLVWKQGKEIDEKIKNIAADTALKYEDIRYYGSQVFMEGLKTGATVVEAVMPKVNFSFGESTTTTTTYKEKGMTRSSSTTKSSSHGRKR